MLFGLDEGQKVIRRMESMVIDSFSQYGGTYDELAELAAILNLLYRDCDITFFSYEERKVVWSSVVNQEKRQELDVVLGRAFADDGKYDIGIPMDVNEKEMILRKGVIQMRIVPLHLGGICLAYLCIEMYSGIKPPLKLNTERFFTLVAAAYYICVRKARDRYLIGIDKGTMLPSREQLMDDLKLCNAGGNSYCVGLVRFINLKQIKEEYGLQDAELRLKDAANIAPKVWKKVYYIGNGALVFVFNEELYPSYAKMEEILDVLAERRNGALYGGVVTPLRENVYETVYILESKSEHLKADAISIVREREVADLSSDEVVETVIVDENAYAERVLDIEIEEVDVSEIHKSMEVQVLDSPAEDVTESSGGDSDKIKGTVEDSGQENFFCDFNKFFGD